MSSPNSDLLQVRGSSPRSDPDRYALACGLIRMETVAVCRSICITVITAPSGGERSSLNVEINGLLIKSYHLNLAGAEEDKANWAIALAYPQRQHLRASNAINIPAFRVGSDNQLQLKIHHGFTEVRPVLGRAE